MLLLTVCQIGAFCALLSLVHKSQEAQLTEQKDALRDQVCVLFVFVRACACVCLRVLE